MLLVLFGSPIASIAADDPPASSSEEIISKLILRSVQRQILLGQYSGMRLYILENERIHKCAQMLVRINFERTGAKHFDIVSEEGWEAANKQVLRKMLSSEEETSTPGQRGNSNAPANTVRQ